MVGFCSAGSPRDSREPGTGEIHSINVLRQVQRVGIGRTLLAEAKKELIGLGFRSAFLWVAKENRSAVAFYERLGGKLTGETTSSLYGEPIAMRQYSWRSITPLS